MMLMIMKRSCVALVLVLQLLSGVSARSSVFARNGYDRHGVALHQTETDPEMLPSSKHPRTLSERAQEEIRSGDDDDEQEEEDGKQMGVSKIGSSPPRCEHKCYGCTPCEATQVPATHDGHAHVRVQYTNYEPEGWKCKCGPALYTP
ncbi:EPIDERMAL PATTERNING FACTOR-like protein 3 isoform X1 [Rhodamnia argentea]|uniref:Epidermal patterning factor-like protein n=1 Tax=Rhodamnia argentea TaxID=178133 RepID=A0A8B8NSI9_9MYRT|nr:EPIDERMAL PATTERNING FACTOR-like protein 3 isoform X1 [Rhodamnia argentea]